MDFKPNEFFIGLADFITILLPGAVFTLVLLMLERNHPTEPGHALYQYALDSETSMVFWVGYLFSSFGLGYFLSSIASGLDPLYDLIRQQYSPYEEDLKKQFDRLDKDKKSCYLQAYKDDKKKKSGNDLIVDPTKEEQMAFEGYKLQYGKHWMRKLSSIVFKLSPEVKIDKSYEEVRKILEKQDTAVRNATNAYKWAGTILEAECPAIHEQAIRPMAASKFFRSLVIVSLFIALLQLGRQLPSQWWLINLVMLTLSLREYIVQRQKSVQKTYQSMVTLTYYKWKA